MDDSIKEAISMNRQELIRAVEDRTLWNHPFIGSPGLGPDSIAWNTHIMPVF